MADLRFQLSQFCPNCSPLLLARSSLPFSAEPFVPLRIGREEKRGCHVRRTQTALLLRIGFGAVASIPLWGKMAEATSQTAGLFRISTQSFGKPELDEWHVDVRQCASGSLAVQMPRQRHPAISVFEQKEASIALCQHAFCLEQLRLPGWKARPLLQMPES